MPNWTIFYGDGTISSGDSASPFDVSGLNVQIIVQWPESASDKPYMVRGDTYYIWYEDRGVWEGVEEFGLWDYLFNIPGRKSVKSGRTVNGDEFDRIHAMAKELING